MLNHPYQTPGTNESFGGKKTRRKCSRFFCMLMNLRPRVIWSKSNSGRGPSALDRPSLDLDQITLGLRFISIQKNLEHFLLVFFPPNCLRAKALRTIWLKSFSVWRPRMISGRMTQVPGLRPGAFTYNTTPVLFQGLNSIVSKSYFRWYNTVFRI